MPDGGLPPLAVDTPFEQHLLPSNATALERAMSGADHRLLSLPTWVIRASWDPDTCPVHLLPYLAQAWSVDEWDPAWTEAQKRQVIDESPEIHRRKGTAWALKKAIAQLGMGAVVREWFQYGGQPYRFRLSLTLATGAVWTTRQAKQLVRVAIANKNVRSWLEQIDLVVPEPAQTPLAIGIVTHQRLVIDTVIGPVTSIAARDSYLYVGVGVHTRLVLDSSIA